MEYRAGKLGGYRPGRGYEVTRVCPHKHRTKSGAESCAVRLSKGSGDWVVVTADRGDKMWRRV